MSESFVVKTNSFEGPLDVLVSLIEKRQLHISDISIAQVTDDFIAFVEEMPETKSAIIAHFILIAATLMLIKSRALLPKISLSADEAESIDELELKLKLLQFIRTVGQQNFAPLWNKSPLYEQLHASRQKEVVFAPPTKTVVTSESLYAGILSALTSLPQEDKLPLTTVKKMISLEDTMSRLLNKVQVGLNMGLREFAGISNAGKRLPREAKESIIVTFLAVLELARRGALEIHQHEQFGDIAMQTLDVDTPRYV
ncbi:MAG: ScpA family protein [bacterium]|nr:ScpA family protein [bacterium]